MESYRIAEGRCSVSTCLQRRTSWDWKAETEGPDLNFDIYKPMKASSRNGQCVAPDLRPSDCVFRNRSLSILATQPPATQCALKNPRTCFEGPFGEVLRATGPAAKANPFRWSTRYQDDETDIVMYPCRPYRDGRFLSRDPIEEAGGFNLYGFVNNNPVSATDQLGLVIETHCDSIDDYLNSLGISFQKSGSYRYTFSGSDLGTGAGDAKMIVTRMLFAGTVFTVSSSGGSATDNLKKHVDARLTIIRNALKANFKLVATLVSKLARGNS